MAKKKSITANRPKIFKEPSKVGRKAIKAMTTEILDELQETAIRQDNVAVKRMPNYLVITEKKLEEKGVIDLKKAFSHSTKKKSSKAGGWYLTIPIRLKTSNMSKKTYRDLRGLDVKAPGQKTVLSEYLYELNKKEITHPALQPKPPSKNVTKVRKKGSKNASYFIFRTVSNKSPANSWMLNRDKVNSNNFSNTNLKNVTSLMRWKMNNM